MEVAGGEFPCCLGCVCLLLLVVAILAVSLPANAAPRVPSFLFLMVTRRVWDGSDRLVGVVSSSVRWFAMLHLVVVLLMLSIGGDVYACGDGRSVACWFAGESLSFLFCWNDSCTSYCCAALSLLVVWMDGCGTVCVCDMVGVTDGTRGYPYIYVSIFRKLQLEEIGWMIHLFPKC
jgi:hypothetical protein